MSVERWLHMTRRSLLTVRRTYALTSVLIALSIALGVNHVITVLKRTEFDHTPYIVFLISCLIVTSIAYFKLFRIIRRHQQQIQTSEVSYGFRQSSIDFCQVQEICFLDSLYSASFLHRLFAHVDQFAVVRCIR